VKAEGHSVYVGLVYLIWDPEYSVETKKRWADEVRLFPILLCVCPETKEQVCLNFCFTSC